MSALPSPPLPFSFPVSSPSTAFAFQLSATVVRGPDPQLPSSPQLLIPPDARGAPWPLCLPPCWDHHDHCPTSTRVSTRKHSSHSAAAEWSPQCSPAILYPFGQGPEPEAGRTQAAMCTPEPLLKSAAKWKEWILQMFSCHAIFLPGAILVIWFGFCFFFPH